MDKLEIKVKLLEARLENIEHVTILAAKILAYHLNNTESDLEELFNEFIESNQKLGFNFQPEFNKFLTEITELN